MACFEAIGVEHTLWNSYRSAAASPWLSQGATVVFILPHWTFKKSQFRLLVIANRLQLMTALGFVACAPNYIQTKNFRPNKAFGLALRFKTVSCKRNRVTSWLITKFLISRKQNQNWDLISLLMTFWRLKKFASETLYVKLISSLTDAYTSQQALAQNAYASESLPRSMAEFPLFLISMFFRPRTYCATCGGLNSIAELCICPSQHGSSPSI